MSTTEENPIITWWNGSTEIMGKEQPNSHLVGGGLLVAVASYGLWQWMRPKPKRTPKLVHDRTSSSNKKAASSKSPFDGMKMQELVDLFFKQLAEGNLDTLHDMLEFKPELLVATDSHGKTPLIQACDRGLTAVANLLLEGM
eukprot:TRINITY_DN2661_c1_g2_i4.p2 TRINITY_DN2661_c1_g2~~TRINITY_DN2661_c1_g2_i4.p2  ORF type:complete len:151 (-),score=35.00 TRINITY_DN2661_c1_g2_i4:606-1031(-)